MENFIQRGDIVTVPAPADVVSGDIVVIGNLCGVAVTSVASGVDVAIRVMGVVELPKDSALDIAIGDFVYVHASVVNKTSAAAAPAGAIGVAVSHALNPSATVRVRLSP